MRELWDQIPRNRPTFSEAQHRLEAMLEDADTMSSVDLGLGLTTIGRQMNMMHARLSALEAKERRHSLAKKYSEAAKVQREIDGLKKLLHGGSAVHASLARKLGIATAGDKIKRGDIDIP